MRTFAPDNDTANPTQPWHLTDAGAKQCLMGCELLRNVCTGLGGVAEDKRDETWQKMVAHYKQRVAKRAKWVSLLPHRTDRERGHYLLDEAYAGLSGLVLTPAQEAPKPAGVSVQAAVEKLAKEHAVPSLSDFAQNQIAAEIPEEDDRG